MTPETLRSLLSDDAKTIHCSLAIGLLEIVRYDENQINPKSARATAIANLIDNCWKVVDQYRINAWPPHKLAKAGSVLDEIEALIKRRFQGPKRVTRDSGGRFRSLEAKEVPPPANISEPDVMAIYKAVMCPEPDFMAMAGR